MAWWVWALIVWATAASAAVVWLTARLAVEVAGREQLDRGDDLWDLVLPAH
jgi:hypothetical protein